MFLRNSKFLNILLLIIFGSVYFGATACLANSYNSCCPDQTVECPMISFQKSPRTTQTKSIEPVLHEFLIAVPVDFHVFSLNQIYSTVDYTLPDYNLQLKIAHPANGPPLA
jgi:hypothetical protein